MYVYTYVVLIASQAKPGQWVLWESVERKKDVRGEL